MQKAKIAGPAVVILLSLSIISGVYLTLQDKVHRKEISLKKIRLSSSPAIGLVEVYGQIYSPYQQGGLLAQTGLLEILDILKSFRENKSIKGVILRINSPGGTIGAVQEITSEIERLREEGKPVVASILDIAASGGYYIAAACDKIVANSGSIVGSIGVIFVSPDLSGLFEKLGIKVETVKSGPYKDVGSIHRPFSRQERVFLQEVIDDAFSQFVDVVSKGRKIPVKKIKELAKGQIFSGRKAKELNLIDELGDLTVAKKVIEELAGIENAKLIKRTYPKWKRIIRFIDRQGQGSLFDFKQQGFAGLRYLYKP